MTSRYSTKRTRKIELQERDIEVLRALARIPFLRTDALAARFAPSTDVMAKRLRLMKRPPNRLIRIVNHPLLRSNHYVPQVFELARNGRQVLADLGIEERPFLYGYRNRREFPHTLILCDFMNNVELALASDPKLSIFPWQDLIANTGTNEIPIPLSNGHSVEPDAMFGLAKNGSYVFFLVEADRRTETIRPTANPEKNSYLRKLRAYREVLVGGTYRSHFGINRSHIYMLNLVSSQRRMERMMAAAADAGMTKFALFTHLPSLGGTGTQPTPDQAAIFKWNNVSAAPFNPCSELLKDRSIGAEGPSRRGETGSGLRVRPDVADTDLMLGGQPS